VTSTGLSSKRIVVTGAAGFLGRHLVEAARASGARVLSVVRNETNAPDIVAMSSLLRDPNLLDGTDVFIHSAAVRHRYGSSPKTYRESNVHLVEALVRAAVNRVGRFVFISSVGVYGFPAVLPVTEQTPFAPVTLYSATKIEAERLVTRLAKQLGLPYTIIRPTIIYGPGDTNGMLDKLVRMIRGRRYLIVGSGDNTLHHTFISDVVDGVFRLSENKRGLNDDFILAGPETTTLARLSQLVARHVDRSIPPVHVPMPFARAVASLVDIAAYRGIAFTEREPPISHEKLDVMAVSVSFDTSKARSAGFSPRIGYEEGIARTLGQAAA